MMHGQKNIKLLSMLYWNEIINDLAKILTWFCSTFFKFIWSSY